KKILVDKRFLVNFFKNVNEKSYVRQLFLKNIEENKFNITMENLCYSNNLNFKELESLFKRIMFDINDFYKHIDGFPGLDNSIQDLRSNSVEAEFEEVKGRYETKEYVEAYLNLLVNKRNSVAHQYEITEIYSIEQFETILNFMKRIVMLVIEFCTSQLLKKGLTRKEKVSDILYPVKVFKSNSNNNNGIMWIRNSSNRPMKKDDKFYWLDKSKRIYRMAHVVRILDNNRLECEELIPFKDYTVEIKTVSSIKNTYKSFILCKLKSQCNPYEYNITV
ncbi:hypothetical protein C0L82_12830, partial [Clostridium perfringens]